MGTSPLSEFDTSSINKGPPVALFDISLVLYCFIPDKTLCEF